MFLNKIKQTNKQKTHSGIFMEMSTYKRSSTYKRLRPGCQILFCYEIASDFGKELALSAPSVMRSELNKISKRVSRIS